MPDMEKLGEKVRELLTAEPSHPVGDSPRPDDPPADEQDVDATHTEPADEQMRTASTLDGERTRDKAEQAERERVAGERFPSVDDSDESSAELGDDA